MVVLRRILRSLVPKKSASAANPQQAMWDLNDLLFISALGEQATGGSPSPTSERTAKDHRTHRPSPGTSGKPTSTISTSTWNDFVGQRDEDDVESLARAVVQRIHDRRIGR